MTVLCINANNNNKASATDSPDGLDAVPPKICETDRKYSARDIFHGVQFLWNWTKLE